MEKLNVLVIGSGGREHALCWKIAQSPLTKRVFCCPGNPGTATCAVNLTTPTTVEEYVALARAHQIDLVVVGPERTLADGVVDCFRAAKIRVVGPTQAAAQLESSKHFAKLIMEAARVPTAAYRVCESERSAEQFLRSNPGSWVLKADGLAAGKGVVVCTSAAEALEQLPSLWKIPGTTKIVIEERLQGVEVSFIAATNGREAQALPAAHDYKRIFDNDEGPNTGGMGAVAPSLRCSGAEASQLLETVILPVLKVMNDRGTPFVGFLYAGLMKAPDGSFKVLEFNARLGDPETQSILPLLESDIVPLLMAVAEERTLPQLRWSMGAAVGVVLASEGYPETPRFGDTIDGLEFARALPNAQIFHAGTRRTAAGTFETAGGRVLNVVGVGATYGDARLSAYRAADMVQFRGRQVRRDIGREE